MVLVSVIVPMRNAEVYISKTLNSILQSNLSSLEVVLVNDGSTDSSVEKAQAITDSRLRIIEGPCQGVAAAFNVGLAAAQGKIITRCDADDYYPPQRLERQIEWLGWHSEFGALCGGYATLNVKGELVTQLNCGKEPEEITQELNQGKTRTHFCTFAVRSQVLRALGGCRTYFNSAEDIDLQLRIGEFCRVWFNPEVTYYYRLHNASLTHTLGTAQRIFFHNIAYEFHQQRAIYGSDDLQRGCSPVPPKAETEPVRKASEQIQGQLLGRAWEEYRNGNKIKAILIGLRAALVLPNSFVTWRSWIALITKSTTIKLPTK